MNTRKTAIRLLLIVPAIIAVLVVLGDKGAVPHASTAQAVGTLTVGLDMQTCGAVQTGCTSIDPGVYGATLPRFESCVDVKTSVNNGFFYIDVFALNASQLVAFYADVAFTTGKMQISQVDVTKFLGGGAMNVSNKTPPVSDGLLETGGADTGGSGHSGSGVLVRLQAQAFIPPAGGIVIPFTITTDPPTAGYPGVTLRAFDGTTPGDTNGDGVYDGPFINATTAQIAVNRPDTGDGDGVSDTCDNCLTTPNGPAQASVPHVGNQLDTDGDGIGDACDPDADGDGILNGADNCPYVANPTQDPSVCADSDGDGIINSLDNCPTVSNVSQLDTDGDGVGDACDPDMDGDGICNTGGPLPNGTLGTPPGGCARGASGADNCPLAANPTQADFNNNGVGDACQDSDGDNILDSVDNCPGIANNSQTDSDGDGVGNICDNCPNTSNPNQLDLDHDFIGDVCDSDMDGDGIPNVSDPDIDGDGALNAADNCPNTSNPNQLDEDHDGIGDVCDSDMDGNGIPNVSDPDIDGDGASNVLEAYVGTNQYERCAATTTKNDEAVDSSPYDNNDDRLVSGGDFLSYAPVFGHGVPPLPPLTTAEHRYDLNQDGKISGGDFLAFSLYFGKTCVP